jgi:RND superfamily putative drug exporter
MLGLAVGIDYALFILSRHREQLADGLDPLESAARAIATSGSAVVFAGLTVIIALVGLVVAGIPFLTSMGLAAALAVAIAVLIALTALPALMGLAGERLRPRPSRRARPAEPAAPRDDEPVGGFFARWVWLATRVPAATIVVVLVGLGALALPARDLQLALPDAGQDPPGSRTRVTYELLAEHFGPGFNGPLIVTAGIVGSDDPLGVMAGLKADIEKMPGVASVPLSTPNRGADTGIVQVVPTSGPQEQATKDLVYRLRAQAEHWRERYGVETAVTGFTAVAIDVSDRLAEALLPFGVFVVGLSLVLLAMVFRSVAVPVKATVGYLFSVLGAFGAVALVFEHGWFASLINLHQTGPVISFLPIILMGILFGLAMDYEVFLVARMREDHVHGESARAAVRTGFIGSGRVVLAAALIMFSVFAFFVPHGSANMKSIAFGLSVGVAIDAFVVRMTLVPAVMMLLGERAWWLPHRLDRRLPSFDVEGESLHHQLRLADWPAPDDPHVVYAEGLAVRAGHRDLFTDLDIRVLPGEVAVVEGEPAARSALLLALSGRLRADAGQARVAGMLLPERASAVRRRAGLVDLAADHAAATVAGLLAVDASRLPLILVDGADAHASSDRSALVDLVTDAHDSGRALVLAVGDADLLPARHLRVAVSASPTALRPDEVRVGA